MIRDAAIAIIRGSRRCGYGGLDDEGEATRLVDALVALGMLNLEEPKSARQKAIDAFWSIEAVATPYAMFKVLDDAGLKIVEK